MDFTCLSIRYIKSVGGLTDEEDHTDSRLDIPKYQQHLWFHVIGYSNQTQKQRWCHVIKGLPRPGPFSCFLTVIHHRRIEQHENSLCIDTCMWPFRGSIIFLYFCMPYLSIRYVFALRKFFLCIRVGETEATFSNKKKRRTFFENYLISRTLTNVLKAIREHVPTKSNRFLNFNFFRRAQFYCCICLDILL